MYMYLQASSSSVILITLPLVVCCLVIVFVRHKEETRKVLVVNFEPHVKGKLQRRVDGLNSDLQKQLNTHFSAKDSDKGSQGQAC